MKSLKQTILEAAKPAVKAFKDVKVGDIAVENASDAEEIGPVVWKGSYKNMIKSKYRHAAPDLGDIDVYKPKELQYDWIVVKDQDYDDYIGMTYNVDEFSAIVLK